MKIPREFFLLIRYLCMSLSVKVHCRLWDGVFSKGRPTVEYWQSQSFTEFRSSRQSSCKLSHYLYRQTVYQGIYSSVKSLSPLWGLVKGWANNRSGSKFHQLLTKWNCHWFNPRGLNGSWEIQHHHVSIPEAFEFWHAVHVMFMDHFCVVVESRQKVT